MQTIHLCVLILVRIKGETLSPPVIFLLTVPSWSVFVDMFLLFLFVFAILSCLFLLPRVTCWEIADLL